MQTNAWIFRGINPQDDSAMPPQAKQGYALYSGEAVFLLEMR